MTDKKTIIGLVLIFIIFLGYSWWSSSKQKENAIAEQDSIRNTQQEVLDTLAQKETQNLQDIINEEELLRTGNDSIKKEILTKKKNELGFFSNVYGKEEKKYILESDLLTLEFSNCGGRMTSICLKDYKDYNKEQVCLLEEKTSNYNLSFFTTNNHIVNTKNLVFEAVNMEKLPKGPLAKGDSASIVFRAYANKEGTDTEPDPSKYIEFVYTLHGGRYDVDHSIRMTGMENIIQSNTRFFDLVWVNDLYRQEKNQKNERQLSSVYYKPFNGDVDNLPDGRDKTEEIKMPLKWISFKQQFFSTTLIAKDQFDNAFVEINSNPEGKDPEQFLCNIQSLIGLPYQHTDHYSFDMSLYLGPNKYNILKEYHLDLERQIPLGWGFFLLQWVNRFAIIPVFNFLEQFNWNYGLIILVLTILVKIVLLPIALKSYKSSAIMKVLQPQIAEINKKYPKQEQAMEKSKATMSLYKKAGANPMTGCIPMIIQFPILIAMFRFFPASIELRHQQFLWADDLSSYDSVLDLPFNIPFYGSHVSLFCILMSAANILYTRVNMSQTPQTNSMPGMKTMMMLMPVMFLFVLNNYSSGLNYYYFLSSCFGFLQIWFVRKTINEDKIKEKIRMADQKPAKKSGFLQRLENMQKMNEQAAKQKKK